MARTGDRSEQAAARGRGLGSRKGACWGRGWPWPRPPWAATGTPGTRRRPRPALSSHPASKNLPEPGPLGQAVCLTLPASEASYPGPGHTQCLVRYYKTVAIAPCTGTQPLCKLGPREAGVWAGTEAGGSGGLQGGLQTPQGFLCAAGAPGGSALGSRVAQPSQQRGSRANRSRLYSFSPGRRVRPEAIDRGIGSWAQG